MSFLRTRSSRRFMRLLLSVTLVSSIPGVSLLPVSLSLALDPRPPRPERHRIPTVFLYSRIERVVTVLAIVL